MKQEKIFAIHMFCKGLISKIYNEFIQLNSKQKKPTSFKKGQRSQQTFFPKKKYRGQTGTENDALYL